MSIWQILSLIGTVVLLSCGQILFKIAANGMNEQGASIAERLLQPSLISALLIYAIATGLWVAVLRVAPLRLAYPFVALAFVIVPMLSWMWLGEPLRASGVIGGIIIVIGVAVSVAFK